MKEMNPKFLRIMLSSVMVVFAILQINDSDALTWGLIYGLVAAFGVLGSSRQNSLRLVISVGYLAFAWSIFPDDYQGVGQMDNQRPEVELARESLGVLIAAGINAFNGWFHHLESRNQKQGE